MSDKTNYFIETKFFLQLVYCMGGGGGGMISSLGHFVTFLKQNRALILYIHFLKFYSSLDETR